MRVRAGEHIISLPATLSRQRSRPKIQELQNSLIFEVQRLFSFSFFRRRTDFCRDYPKSVKEGRNSVSSSHNGHRTAPQAKRRRIHDSVQDTPLGQVLRVRSTAPIGDGGWPATAIKRHVCFLSRFGYRCNSRQQEGCISFPR